MTAVFIIVILINIIITLQVFNQGPSSDKTALLVRKQQFSASGKGLRSLSSQGQLVPEGKPMRPPMAAHGNSSPFTKTHQCCTNFIPLVFLS